MLIYICYGCVNLVLFCNLGAKLRIDGDNATCDVRKCEIVGTATQIECAKQLIEEKLAEDKKFKAKFGMLITC